MSTPDSVVLILSVTRTTILFPSILSTIPFLLAIIVTPESTATVFSTPVPTSGDSACISGTACLIIFEPIRARLASSFSRKGISEAAHETTCLGETSIKSMSSGLVIIKSPSLLHETNLVTKEPLESSSLLA